MGVDAQPQGLFRPVEHQERVRQHEINEGNPQFIAGGLRHGRFDPVDVFVADVAHGASHESRHAGNRHRPVAGDLGFDELERVVGRGHPLGGTAGFADLGEPGKTGEDLAGPAADEAVAGDRVAPLDGFQKVGRSGALEPGISRHRRLEIRHQVGIDGHDVAVFTQLKKSFPGRLDVHGGGQPLWAGRGGGQGE